MQPNKNKMGDHLYVQMRQYPQKVSYKDVRSKGINSIGRAIWYYQKQNN